MCVLAFSKSPSSLHHRNTICPPFQIGTSHSLAYHTLSLSRFSLKKKKKITWNPNYFLQIETPLSLSCESFLLSKEEVFSQVIFSLAQFTLSLRCILHVSCVFSFTISLHWLMNNAIYNGWVVWWVRMGILLTKSGLGPLGHVFGMINYDSVFF